MAEQARARNILQGLNVGDCPRHEVAGPEIHEPCGCKRLQVCVEPDPDVPKQPKRDAV